jgi:hypothetical protein
MWVIGDRSGKKRGEGRVLIKFDVVWMKGGGGRVVIKSDVVWMSWSLLQSL